MISTLVTVLLIAKSSWCLPLDQFYPFGDENDQVLHSSSNFPVYLSGDFNFDLTSRGELYIRPNGIITFTSDIPESISTGRPTLPIQDADFIAPYWFNSGLTLDTCNDSLNFTPNDNFSTGCRYNSTVYYGYQSSQFRVNREIRESFFDARTRYFYAFYIFVVTWVIVDTKDAIPEPKKTAFQCILAYGAEGDGSYIIFNYADGLSELADGSNTVSVQAGINSAFRPTANFISIPNTSNISITSNVGIPGVWMFQTNTRPFTRPFIPIHVTINTTDEQIVGQSFTLECRIQRAEGLIGTFDIIWTVQRSIEVRSMKNISGSLISNYTDIYTISELRRSDYFANYRCDVIVNLTQQLNVSAEFEINNLTQPPELIISPKQSPLRVTVGGHLPIYCTAVRGVPVPIVQWYSEGFPVYPSHSSYQQVYIVPTDSPHTTTYTCVETRYFYPAGVVSELRVNVTVVVEEACPRLRAPRRGEITITEDGQLAFFSCNRGFTMRGSNILKCRNGNWNSSPPSCHSISRFCRQRCNF